jgi:hypothetical protein
VDIQSPDHLPQSGNLLFDDDVTAAVQQLKYHPNTILSGKAYQIRKYLFAPTGLTLRDCSSPPSWEPFTGA